MRILLKGKGKGKTTALVYASSVNGSVIVCQSVQRAQHVKTMVQQLGVDIPEPIVYTKLLKGEITSNNYLIDDLDDIVSDLFKCCVIDCVTFSKTDYNK